MIYDCAPIVDTKIGDLPAGIGLYSDTWATSSASSATVALLRAVFSALCAAPSAAAGAPADADAAAAIAAAKADEKIAPALEGMATVKELYVPGKLVNLVVRPR